MYLVEVDNLIWKRNTRIRIQTLWRKSAVMHVIKCNHIYSFIFSCWLLFVLIANEYNSLVKQFLLLSNIKNFPCITQPRRVWNVWVLCCSVGTCDRCTRESTSGSSAELLQQLMFISTGNLRCCTVYHHMVLHTA